MTAETTTEERIRARAYSLWEAAGRQHGSHEQHWHQAAFEIAAECAPTKAVKAKAAPKAKPTVKAPAKKKAA